MDYQEEGNTHNSTTVFRMVSGHDSLEQATAGVFGNKADQTRINLSGEYRMEVTL